MSVDASNTHIARLLATRSDGKGYGSWYYLLPMPWNLVTAETGPFLFGHDL